MPQITKSDLKNLPPKVDHSDKVLYVGNQGYIGSCIGFGVTQAREIMFHPLRVDLSPWYLYYITQKHDRLKGEEYSGSFIEDALRVMETHGCCDTEHWELDPKNKKYRGKPKADSGSNAEAHKVGAYFKIENHKDALRYSLSQGDCPVVTLRLTEGFMAAENDGIVSNGTMSRGYHAMTLVGYDDKRQEFKLLNSWGEDWGQGGYCFVDYKLMMGMLQSAYYMTDDYKNELKVVSFFKSIWGWIKKRIFGKK